MIRELSPFAVGRRVFKPSRPGRVEDPAVRSVQTIRSVIGFAAVAWVVVSYRLVDSVGDAASQRFSEAWDNVLVLCVTFPVVVAVFIVTRGRGRRGLCLRRTWKPLRALLSVFGGMGTFALAMAPGAEDIRALAGPLQPVVTVVGFVFLLVWMVPFVLYGIVMSLAHVFRTADIHEYLPPLLTTVTVWELAALGLVSDSYAGVPGTVRILLLLGGPISVTVVSAWEYHRLRTHPAVSA